MQKRTIALVAIVLVCALVGAGIAIAVANSSKSSTKSGGNAGNTDTNEAVNPPDSNGNDNENGNGDGGTEEGNGNGEGNGEGTGSKNEGGNVGSGSKPTEEKGITSDPAKADYTVSVLAIGDWGVTLGQPSSCCRRRSERRALDVHAQDVVAAVLDRQAGVQKPKPQAILGHGDSFYWTGINGPEDQQYRFDATFESRYNGANLKDIPWLNVMGNHDYGGSSYICSRGGTYVACNSVEELLQGMEEKFRMQAEYKSHQGDRWRMDDHFYVHRVSDPASNVSIDIFNIDNNDADVHGMKQICCQCYSYGGGDFCTRVYRGHQYCIGGDTAMYDACANKLKEWAKDSRDKLIKAAKESDATFKIVNAHYSPYQHYGVEGVKRWFDVLEDLGIQAWVSGHTHGEKHDYGSGVRMHFIENGAGGGIASESGSPVNNEAGDRVKQLWAFAGENYGIFSFTASKEWMMAKYHSYPRGWKPSDPFRAEDLPGVETQYCWYIPVDGGKGRPCVPHEDYKGPYPPLHPYGQEEATE